jgi:hypothetical protein
MLIPFLIILLITDSNNEPLPGAKIELVNKHKVCYTDLHGHCVVPSDCNVMVDYISYKTKIVSKDSLEYPIMLQLR